MISFLIAFFSIVVLAALHELGHFLIAKKCGVKVEEFGIGLPPRIFSKKMGETIYSFNWLPFGAFVRLEGEEEKVDTPTSFSNQPIKNKILITLGGVISFWLIAILIYSFLSFYGSRVVVQGPGLDNLSDFKVGIFSVAENSPAQKSGLQSGDFIEKITIKDKTLEPTKIGEIQDFIDNHLGETLKITIKRGDQKIKKEVLARSSSPENQGPIGVSLVRTGLQKYPWYLSVWEGIKKTWEGTVLVVKFYGSMFSKLFQGEFNDENLVSSIGIFQMIAKSQEFGLFYFLSFIAFIAINLAVFNSLPIPLVDGGRVAFFLIEAIRNKPIPEKIENNINLVSFVFLGGLIIWVTIRDIINLF